MMESRGMDAGDGVPLRLQESKGNNTSERQSHSAKASTNRRRCTSVALVVIVAVILAQKATRVLSFVGVGLGW